VWLLTVALCLLVGGYNLARRSLERAGAAFGALAVVLVVGCDTAAVVLFLLLAHDARLFPQSTTWLTFAGLGIALTGGALALRDPQRYARYNWCRA
jgi:drug/metabolite transporter (DMT)-like permease